MSYKPHKALQESHNSLLFQHFLFFSEYQPYGTKLIKEFFSESMKNDRGEDVSTREIKKILETVVLEENKKKPLTDEKLALILKEKGYPIARRTVAKYREQLELPVARLRKEI